MVLLSSYGGEGWITTTSTVEHYQTTETKRISSAPESSKANVAAPLAANPTVWYDKLAMDEELLARHNRRRKERQNKTRGDARKGNRYMEGVRVRGDC